MRSVIWILLLACLAFSGAGALNHYGVMVHGDANVEKELQSRFKGKGQPLFLVHELRSGVTNGDIIRFEDKVVLVDGSVMQTLQAVGALKGLKQSPVLRLQAKSLSSVWQSRGSMVQNAREQKAYRLGGEVIKVFEDYFGKAPASDEIVLRFVGKDLEMLLPDALLDKLTFATVRKVPQQGGKPLLVSLPPSQHQFQADSLLWRIWGADPSAPESDLAYGVSGVLPPGLEWVDSLHALRGSLDSAGAFSLVAWVKNPSGLYDSLSFKIEVAPNHTPEFIESTAPSVLENQEYLWTLPIRDVDHLLPTLRCAVVDSIPLWNVDSLCQLKGFPDSTWSGYSEITILVQDPRGASDTATFVLQKNPSTPSPLKAIRFLLPRDSLVVGKARSWPVSSLLTPGISLVSVSGMDSVSLVPGGGSQTLLRIKPQMPGKGKLRFQIASAGDTVVIEQDIVATPNRPPVFKSALSAHQVREGAGLSYKPVAVDPDGDFVKLAAMYSDGEGVEWRGYEIPLWTTTPGTYSLDVFASDGVNPSVPQRITWEVEADRKEWLGLSGRMLTVGPKPYYWLDYRMGSGRFGVYTPKVMEVFKSATLATKEWPFVFAGGSMLGENGLAHGNWLYVDLGLQLRSPGKKLISGGFMFGIDGHWTSSNKKNPWVFELEINAHSNQAILVVDTSNWNEAELVLTLDAGNENVSMKNVNTDSLLNALFGPVYSKIIHDATEKENTVLISRLEGFYPIHDMGNYGLLLAGVVAWREDYLNRLVLNQWTGLSLRHQVDWRYFNMTQTLRFGLFAGGYDKGTVRYDVLVNLGKWF